MDTMRNCIIPSALVVLTSVIITFFVISCGPKRVPFKIDDFIENRYVQVVISDLQELSPNIFYTSPHSLIKTDKNEVSIRPTVTYDIINMKINFLWKEVNPRYNNTTVEMSEKVYGALVFENSGVRLCYGRTFNYSAATVVSESEQVSIKICDNMIGRTPRGEARASAHLLGIKAKIKRVLGRYIK